MRKFKSNAIVGVEIVLVLALTACLVSAQQTVPPTGAAEKEKLSDLWDNFLHYILLARPEVAGSYGQAIIDANPDPRNLYNLSVKTEKGRDPSSLILARGRALKDLGPIVDKIAGIIDAGARAVRTDPAEIARWIDMLGGNPRQFLEATDRLIDAGEYAVPQMINKLTDVKTDSLLRERIVTVLPRLGGRQQGVSGRVSVVRALSAALAVEDPAVKEVICRTLGKIEYPQAGPYLKELADQKGLMERTQNAALSALSSCCGRVALKKPVAELFYDLALKYYNREESCNPDSRYDTANVWYWQEGLGLTYKVVPVSIFNEVYAMRSARRALAHDNEFDPAVVIWIAANLRKEANLAGAKDPTHQAGQPGANFTALAAGAGYLQRVLNIAMKDGDVEVALVAIKALGQTTGAKNLVATVAGGAQPLVAALTYPSRRVRYLAAEALGSSLPQKRFPGWHLVVPVLTEALRATGTPTVVLADPDLDHRNKVKDLLRGSGCNVIDDMSFAKAVQTARSGGGLDLVVLSSKITAPDFTDAVAALRTEAVLARTPVIIITAQGDVAAVNNLAKNDSLVIVLSDEGLDAAGLAEAIKSASEKASGAAAMDEAQAVEWSIRAAKCLRLLAMTNNPVYDLTDATKSLIAAMSDKRDEVRIASAQALAQFRAVEAQAAIAALAVDTEAAEQTRIAAYTALSESVRRFGNQLTEKQVRAVIDDVMGDGSLDIRNAAAQTMGALSLPSEKVKELIKTAG
ncbi:MAG: response regulator [Planctomycetota bacterium]|nr:response regulator [Planctomycetota bacterium]